jgi:hypothetical protein
MMFIASNLCIMLIGIENYEFFVKGFRGVTFTHIALYEGAFAGLIFCENLGYLMLAEKFHVISTRVPDKFENKPIKERTICEKAVFWACIVLNATLAIILAVSGI